MVQNYQSLAPVYFDKTRLEDIEFQFVCSNKFREAMFSLLLNEFDTNLNKYHSRLKHANAKLQSTKIYKISKEIPNLSFKEQRKNEEKARSKLYNVLGIDQLSLKFDEQLHIEDFIVYSSSPKLNNTNTNWYHLVYRLMHKNLSADQLKLLNKLFNKNSNWVDQLCYLFNISRASYYWIKRMDFRLYCRESEGD